MPSLYVDETGTSGKPSIIFLHGVGASGWMWQQQIKALGDFHCLNVDLPGHGKSHQREWVSFKDTADQIASIIQTQATHGRAHVVGLSLGAYITLILLEHHTDLIDHAVISGVTIAPMPNRSLLTPQVWLMGTLKKRRWLVKAQAKALNLSLQMQADFVENLRLMSMKSYRCICEEAVNFSLSPALKHIYTPILVTAGSREVKIITESVTAIPQIMPKAQGRLAPGCKHGWNVEAPSLFTAMVRAWITDAPLPSGLQTI